MTNKYLLGLAAILGSIAIHLALTYLWPQTTVQQVPAASPQAPSVAMLARSFSDLVDSNTQVKPVQNAVLKPTAISQRVKPKPIKIETVKPVTPTIQPLQASNAKVTKPLPTAPTKTTAKPASITKAVTLPATPVPLPKPEVKAVAAVVEITPQATTTTVSKPLSQPVSKPKSQPVTPSPVVSPMQDNAKTLAPSPTPKEQTIPVTTATKLPSNPSAKEPIKATDDAGEQEHTQPARSAVPEVSKEAKGYAKIVYQHIASKPQRKVRGRGTVTIEFKLTTNGSIAYAKVVKSSGRTRVDKAGLNHVKRSAPFPTPPSQASLTFTLPISIR